jgi:hypothetical protein
MSLDAHNQTQETDDTHETGETSVLRLARAHVMHKRFRPFAHPFVYRLFCLQARIDRPQALQQHNSWLFGVNRSRPVSLMNADHGYRDGGDLMRWLEDTVNAVGVSRPAGAVWLQCFPRLLGYVFNPVSFWYLYDEQGQLRVIVAEVNNTFGQHHHYVLSNEDGGVIESGALLTCQKVFHVSPFCSVVGSYRFEYLVNRKVTRMTIDYFDDESQPDPLIHTAIAAEPERFTTANLLSAIIRMPWMTYGVIARIHWHALKLWRRGAKFHRLPALPSHEVTSNQRKTL